MYTTFLEKLWAKSRKDFFSGKEHFMSYWSPNKQTTLVSVYLYLRKI